MIKTKTKKIRDELIITPVLIFIIMLKDFFKKKVKSKNEKEKVRKTKKKQANKQTKVTYNSRSSVGLSVTSATQYARTLNSSWSVNYAFRQNADGIL